MAAASLPPSHYSEPRCRGLCTTVLDHDATRPHAMRFQMPDPGRELGLTRYMPPSHHTTTQKSPMGRLPLLLVLAPLTTGMSLAQRSMQMGLPQQRRASSLWSIVCPPSAACLTYCPEEDKVIVWRVCVVVLAVWYGVWVMNISYLPARPQP